MKLRLKATLILFGILFSFISNGQQFNLGTPPVDNFPTKVYHAATQNWDISQDSKGRIFVANNSGVLEHDGFNWRTHPIGNGTIVRSVLVAENGNIYVGGQGEFGIFEKSSNGKLVYQSLSQLLTSEQGGFGDVWDIIEQQEGVFFRTDKRVFLYQNGQVIPFDFSTPLIYMGRLFNEIFVQNNEQKLMVFRDGKFQSAPNKWQINGSIIEALPYHTDTILMVTNQDGIYYFTEDKNGVWKTDGEESFLSGRLFCAALLPNNMIAIGSTNNGVFILDRSRRVLQHLNKNNGLQNNTILSIFTDRTGDLWLGLDNGIDLVKISSPYTTIYPDGELEGTGYGVEVFEDNLYFGTNTGLYFTPLKSQYLPSEKNNFKLVPGTEGQVWSLQVLENELLIGHHNGAFALKNGQLRLLTDFLGVWRFLPMGKGKAISGNYEGMALFEKKAIGWQFENKITGLTESSRLMAPSIDDGLWMAHPYRGIFKISINDSGESEVKFFGKKEGLPSNLENQVFTLGQKPVFTGKLGVFEFSSQDEMFIPSVHFNNVLGMEKHISFLRKDEDGNIWYVSGDDVGVLLIEDNSIEKKIVRLEFPELVGRPMNGFEFIYPMKNGNTILATEKGFEHFNWITVNENQHHPFNVILHEISLETEGDSMLFGGHFNIENGVKRLELKHHQNNLRFVFGASDFHGQELIKFSHRIEEDGKWTEWSGDSRLIFNDLHPGDYTFQLKARNRFGHESEVLSYPFKIYPPWYTSTLAKVIYWLLLFGIFLYYIIRQQRRYESEKEELKISHQKRQEEQQEKVKRSEEIINQLEKEKLEAEVSYKNQELASTTMNLVQKNEFLSSIREALDKLKAHQEIGGEVKKEIKRIIRLIENDANLQDDWESFTRHFDQVHSDFLKRLGAEFPKLSPNDFKLCAYLRMNLSSKEIASLMNISVRGVEASRYRLRKRLGIPTSTNLTEFILKL